METETSFDLEQAIVSWRDELLAEPGITEDNLRELESHLRETIAAAHKSSDTERAAFESALKRMGSRDQIVTEHTKENAGLLWKQCLFWMCWPCIVLPALIEFERFISHAIADLVQHRLHELGYGVMVIMGIAHVLAVTITIRALVRVQTGRGVLIRNAIGWLVASRARVFATAITFIFLGNVFLLTFVFAPWGVGKYSNQHVQDYLGNLSATVVFNGVLLTLLTWLQPFAGHRRFAKPVDHPTEPSGLRRTGPTRSIRFGLLWLTAGCVLMQIGKLCYAEFSNAATISIQGCLVLLLIFLWWERRETTKLSTIHCASGDDTQLPETDTSNFNRRANEGTKAHWRVAVTGLAIIALTLQSAPFLGDRVNMYLPIFSLGLLLLLAVTVWLQIKSEHAESAFVNSPVAPNRVWRLRVKWMVVGGVFLHLFYMLDKGIGRTTNLLTDWTLVRVVVGIAVPVASIYLLSRISAEQNFRSSNPARTGGLMMSAVLLITALALHFGVTWYNLSQSSFVMTFSNILYSWFNNVIWPLGIFGFFLWMKRQHSGTAASKELTLQ